jgi:hypothetical protein
LIGEYSTRVKEVSLKFHPLGEIVLLPETKNTLELAVKLLEYISSDTKFPSDFLNSSLYNEFITKWHLRLMKGIQEYSVKLCFHSIEIFQEKSEVEKFRAIVESSVVLQLDPKKAEENLKSYFVGNEPLRIGVENELERRKYLENFQKLRNSDGWTERNNKNGVRLLTKETQVMPQLFRIDCQGI